MYSLASSKLGKYCTTISPHNEESPKCQTEQILLIHITPHLTNKAQRREHPETTATSRDRYNFPIYVVRRKQRRRKQRPYNVHGDFSLFLRLLLEKVKVVKFLLFFLARY